MDSGSIATYVISALLLGSFIYLFLKNRKRMNRPPSENIRELTDQNFHSIIKKGVSLVDFWAAWCGPCRVQGPIVDEIADEMKDKANICKMDIDTHRVIPGKFGIQSIPTLLIFKEGRVVQKFVGVKSKSVLIQAIQSHLS